MAFLTQENVLIYFKRIIPMVLLASFLQGCQINYILKSGYNQALLLRARQPIDEALQDPAVPEEFKRKLRLTQEAKHFAETTLHLKPTHNYDSFVMLNRDAVTWAASAAPRFELSAYLWSFPIVGQVPYKRYFTVDEAKSEAHRLETEGYDTYVRGVSAYSTLGWFDDPLLSSMLRMSDADLVDTIIHETTHATIYIKSQADFNERLAVFVGFVGAEKFYTEKEGLDSKTVQQLKLENEDGKLFSKFLTEEIQTLEQFYKNLKASSAAEPEKLTQKNQALESMVNRYKTNVVPKMKTRAYAEIFHTTPNNARLIALKTYYQDLSDFERAYAKLNRDFPKFLDFCKSLAKSDNPERDLKALSGYDPHAE